MTNIQTLTAPVGKSIHIWLPENPSTGFRWSIHDIPQLVELVEDSWSIEAAEMDLVAGASGHRVFEFETLRVGSEVIRFRLSREFDPEEYGEVSFDFQIMPEIVKKSRLREEWDWAYDVLRDETLPVSDRLRVLKGYWLG